MKKLKKPILAIIFVAGMIVVPLSNVSASTHQPAVHCYPDPATYLCD